MTPRTRQHPVAPYRMYDREGRLLYIGITGDPRRRWRQHRDERDWWYDVVTIRMEHYPGRYPALRAEQAAIKVERPLYNIQDAEHR